MPMPAMPDTLPFVSIVIPTLNAAKPLSECLDAIMRQDYPREAFEVVIADAGSTDATREIAREKGVDRITDNPLTTGEAGKAAGIKVAKGELIALIDSDNILPDPAWLRRMVAPLMADPTLIASEPIAYTCRDGDPPLTQYFALLGMNDPLCLFTGNYDRECAITGRWTDLPVATEDCGDYLAVTLSPEAMPTIGANGFIFRRELLDGVNWEPYFFDIDILYQKLLAGETCKVAKVKCGIIHLYCADLKDFRRKQRRRIRDFLFFAEAKQRSYPWDQQKKRGVGLFCLATVTLLPLLWQAARGFRRVPKAVWLYHVSVCWITLGVYGWATLMKFFGVKPEMVTRTGWKQ